MGFLIDIIDIDPQPEDPEERMHREMPVKEDGFGIGRPPVTVAFPSPPQMLEVQIQAYGCGIRVGVQFEGLRVQRLIRRAPVDIDLRNQARSEDRIFVFAVPMTNVTYLVQDEIIKDPLHHPPSPHHASGIPGHGMEQRGVVLPSPSEQLLEITVKPLVVKRRDLFGAGISDIGERIRMGGDAEE
jgi:hypothetical protein